MKKQQGVTLIELMVVLVILGIVASVAYPAYQQQLAKSRRADCAGALVGLASAMERFSTLNNTYEGAAVAALPAAPAIFATTCPVNGGAATYNLTIQAAGPSTFTVHAAPIGAQTGDKCGTLMLTNTGSKDVTGQHAGVTWDQCW